jgi:cardiolipin synthase
MRIIPALALIALAGCNTLPIIDTTSHSSVIALERARLSETQVGTGLVAGNKVVLLQNGPATYRAMLAAIAGARNHINMESYIFEDDEIGQKFAAALMAKQAQGVQVSLIYDSVGSSKSPREFFKQLTDGGIQVLEFNPLNPLAGNKTVYQVANRDHRKLLIVDGRTAFVGGVNISGVYSSGSSALQSKDKPGASPAWRDTHLQVQGPVVAEFQKLFLATWEAQKGEAMAQRNFFPPVASGGTEVVRAVGSSPDDPYSLIYATLITAIDSAKTAVRITNAYFVPDPQLLAALIGAAGRGVDVQLILPSNTDNWMVLNAGRSHYENLLDSGVKIYERRGPLLHAKTALIDGVWATVGSANLDRRSFLHNQEINAVVLGPEFGAQMQAMFDADIAVSDAITLEKWQQRSLAAHLKEVGARAWAYWL